MINFILCFIIIIECFLLMFFNNFVVSLVLWFVILVVGLFISNKFGFWFNSMLIFSYCFCLWDKFFFSYWCFLDNFINLMVLLMCFICFWFNLWKSVLNMLWFLFKVNFRFLNIVRFLIIVGFWNLWLIFILVMFVLLNLVRFIELWKNILFLLGFNLLVIIFIMVVLFVSLGLIIVCSLFGLIVNDKLFNVLNLLKDLVILFMYKICLGICLVIIFMMVFLNWRWV